MTDADLSRAPGFDVENVNRINIAKRGNTPVGPKMGLEGEPVAVRGPTNLSSGIIPHLRSEGNFAGAEIEYLKVPR